MTPIKKKLGAWAAVVPIVVGEIVYWQYLASLAGIAILLVILYLMWAGTYWTLLQVRRLYLITQPRARSRLSTHNTAERTRAWPAP